MVPAFKAGDFLRQTLNSVLPQDPGPAQMQIEVVDDCSLDGQAQQIVREVAGERVAFHRNEQNLGIAGNWNECIRRARGHVVHLLHQDDLVEPGFFERLRAAFETAPHAGAAFCRFGYVNEHGQRTWEAPALRTDAGFLEGWLNQIAVKCLIQCPAIVVKRSTYEQLGGFHPDLRLALDWEMWVRIAARFPVWYEPVLGAFYRQHEGSESIRLSKAGRWTQDQLQAIALFSQYIPAPQRDVLVTGARHECARIALRQARQFAKTGEWALAKKMADCAVEADPGFSTRRRALILKAQSKAKRIWRSISS
jgi:glycosyltransferase involved in cell wall biosynthesis